MTMQDLELALEERAIDFALKAAELLAEEYGLHRRSELLLTKSIQRGLNEVVMRSVDAIKALSAEAPKKKPCV